MHVVYILGLHTKRGACSLINKGPKQPVTPHVSFNTVFQPNVFPDESPGIFASSPDQIRDLLLTNQMSFTTTSRHISVENNFIHRLCIDYTEKS